VDVGRVLMVGLDGGTWNVFGRLVEQGVMPNLAALMRRGTWGVLESTVPPVTLPGWASFMTGKNPGAHGVYGFVRMLPDRYETGGLANASHVRSSTLWQHVGHAGKRVALVSVPPSFPLPEVNGVVVGCMLTPPGQPLASPPELAAELRDYVVDVPAPRGIKAGQPDYGARGSTYLDGLTEQTRQRTALALRFLREGTDLVCVVYYAPDRIQHYFWPYVAGETRDEHPAVQHGIDATLAALDQSLGALANELAPDDTLVLMSDHGCRRKPDQAVYVNRWLVEQGFLHERPLWRLRRRILSKIMSRERRRRYDTEEQRLVRAKTKAWAQTLDPSTVGVWVHAATRYPLGCVTADQYETVRDDLIQRMRAFTNQRGQAVFDRVDRREDVYTGPFVAEAPDILATCSSVAGAIYGSLARDLRARTAFGPFEELGFTGTHDSRGIYLFAGAHVRAAGEHRSLPIESLAPTALHLLGIPVPRGMDGPVCTSVLDETFVLEQPVQYVDDELEQSPGSGPSWSSSEDEAKIREHLQALGYFE
jgi:predicted AlkP superfamily phosphohydrolase/phosphomutase